MTTNAPVPCTHALQFFDGSNTYCAVCREFMHAGKPIPPNPLTRIVCKCGNDKFRAGLDSGQIYCAECGEDLW